MNLARKIQRKQNVTKKSAIKTQRKGAVAFGIMADTTLVKALAINEMVPSGNTPPKLPIGQSRALIEGRNVWVNSVVCTDPERALKPGDYIAVFPNAQMERYVGEHGTSIRMRDNVGM